MFSTSVGRRLIVITLTLVTLVLGIVLTIAIDTATGVLRNLTEASFRQQHESLINILERQVLSIEEKVDQLGVEAEGRSRWAASAFRAYVIDYVGSSGTNPDIINVNIYRTEDQDQVYTYDYLEPADLPAGVILPFNRGTDIEDIPADAWILEGVDRDNSFWHGPDLPLYGDYEGLVVSYAVPISDPAGLVWVDVPLTVFEAEIETLLEIETVSQDAGYTVLVGAGQDLRVIAAVDAPSERAIVGEPLVSLGELPATDEAILMSDPLVPDQRAFTLASFVPGTGWLLLRAVPEQWLPTALPFNSLARLVVVTVVGLFFLAITIQQYMTRVISRPIDELSHVAQQIGQGNMNHEIGHLERQDDIGVMANALRDMKSNLVASYEELERWSRTLEERVNERTVELEIAQKEAQSAAAELRAVYDESLLVVSDYQLATILETLTRRMYTLLESSYTSVWLVTEDGGHLQLVASTDSKQGEVGMTIAIGQGLVGQVAESGDIRVVDDYPNWSGRLHQDTTGTIHQAMAVPLIFSGQVIGAIFVARTYESNYFDVDEQHLLRLFANLVSPAVRNAQLFTQLDKAVKEAQRANVVKTRFLASVTHELRTPLNLVINNMDFMRIGAFGEVNDEQKERLDQTINSAEHLLYLINDLLDVSKIEAGEMQMNMQEASLQPILSDALANTEVLLEKFGKVDKIEIVTEIDEDIPKFPMDTRRIRQVLVNLLSNALKFTDRGSVTVRAQNRRHYVRVEVTDTGMGIPESEVHKLFEAFERTRDAKAKAIEGTGLGLPISKFLVEAHGGEMDVKSEVGVGTTFSVTLPFKQREKVPATAQPMTTLLDRAQAEDGQVEE